MTEIKKNKIVLLVSVLMLIMPTSINGELSDIPKLIIYGMSFAIVLLYPKLDKTKTFIVFVCLLIMVSFTALNTKGVVSGVRQFIPLTSLFIILSIDYKYFIINDKILSFSLFFLLFIVNALGYSVLIENQTIISFFIKYYAFGYEELAKNMYSQGKPILFFISHAIAGVIYGILFFLAIMWGVHTRRKIFSILGLLLIPLIINLQSNTSYLVLFIIYSYSFILLKFKYKILYTLLTLSIIYYLWGVIADLGLDIDFFLGNSNNGFLSRYDSTSGVYAGSFKTILNNPFVGTGLVFETADQYKADSGLMNDLLRGGIFYFLLVKYLFYKSFYKCTNNKKLSLLILLFFTIMSIVYAFSMSLRGPAIILFIHIYLSSVFHKKTHNSDA